MTFLVTLLAHSNIVSPTCRHLLLLVLTLVFATGSLNYDLLHFGYLAFSLVFFRIRSQIMDKGNAILNYLRLYNFLLIIASLIYQAPAFEYKTARSCSLPYDIWNIIGLYKYEYGERRQKLTLRHRAFVEGNLAGLLKSERHKEKHRKGSRRLCASSALLSSSRKL